VAWRCKVAVSGIQNSVEPRGPRGRAEVLSVVLDWRSGCLGASTS
jgi:hypothetical protein